MEEGNNSGKVIGALIVGAAIGGALGILFAPDKGSKTRAKIIGSAEDLNETLQLKFNTLLTDAKKEFDAITHQAAKLVSDGEIALKQL